MKGSAARFRRGASSCGVGTAVYRTGAVRLASRDSQLHRTKELRRKVCRNRWNGGTRRASGSTLVYNAAGPLPLALASIARRVRRSIYLISSNLGRLWMVRQEAAVRALRNFFIAFVTVMLAGTIAAYYWGKPYLNQEVLPAACSSLSSMTGREVTIEEVERLEAAGITGVLPVACFKSISVGPGEFEKSTLKADRIDLMFNPLLSLLRRAIVVSMIVNSPSTQLIQADNFSWLGYPHDTEPSARQLIQMPRVEDRHIKKHKDVSKVFEEEPTVRIVLSALAEMLVSSIQVSVDRIVVRDGTVFAFAHRDTLPRRFQNLQGTAKLGKGYHSVQVEMVAQAFERDPSQTKCTMLHPAAKRNLRKDAPSAPPAESQLPSTEILEASLGPVATTPPGGDLYLRVVGRDIGMQKKSGDLSVTVGGSRLSAPLIDRLLEIPMDISDGQIDGEITLRSFNAETWTFPDIYGKLRCSNGHLHFWDATDDLSDVNMTMLFEGKRMYLHNTKGYYGAIPIQVTGDLDIDPDDGEYRLMLQVPLVEVNDLRETLAVRPLPYPVRGFARGSIQVTGPLEKPIYSGRISAIENSHDRKSRGIIQRGRAIEQSGAVGSYDKVLFRGASCVFTLDTSTSMLDLHSIEAEPLAGGRVSGSGMMWIAPEAEEDERAMSISLMGQDIPVEPILEEYLPDKASLPPSLKLGLANGEGSVKGSLISPTLSAKWHAPLAEASGNVRISRDAIQFRSDAPTLGLNATLLTVYPNAELARFATTQEEATSAAQPLIEGCDIHLNIQGADLMSLVAKQDNVNTSVPPPFRLKMYGRTRFKGELTKKPKDTCDGGTLDACHPVLGTYEGELTLSGVKLNQLSIAPQLKGKLELSPSSLLLRARGRPDESLDIQLCNQTEIAEVDAKHAPIPSKSHKSFTVTNAKASTTDVSHNVGENVSDPTQRLIKSPQVEGYFGLRRGQLRSGGLVSSSQVKLDIANLQLDDLELASLRGTLDEGLLDLNLETQSGHGHVSFSKPKFSGLQGESFEGNARWTGDVLRVERAILEQERSRYEVSGEYIVPSTAFPVEISQQDRIEREGPASMPSQLLGGRWRWQVFVPAADVEEMLPAIQLLTRAKRSVPGNYLRAKTKFIDGIRSSIGAAADALYVQVEKAAAAAAAEETKRVQNQAETEPEKEGAPARLKRRLSFVGGFGLHEAATRHVHTTPTLQDLRGSWQGTLLSYGGGTGSTAAEFDLQGQEWQWGPYNMENVIASGSYHSMDGLQFKRLQLDMGTASLKVGGSMFGMKQDAHIALSDFPVQLVQPILHSFPKSPGSADGSLDGIERKGSRPDFGDMGGKLFLECTLGGSVKSPECDVELRLLDGILNGTRMAMARASAAVTASQRLSFDAHLRPAEGSGNMHLVGSIPLYNLASAVPQAQSSFQKILSPSRAKTADGSIEIDAAVKDSGMKLLAALVPQLRWMQGSADIALQLRGTLAEPVADGVAHVNKATVSCQWLPRPLTNLVATVRLQKNRLHVEALDGRVGRRGLIRVQGSLPLDAHKVPDVGTEEQDAGLHILARNLEVRVRNVYNGIVDGTLQIDGSVSRPEIGGSVNFSRGIAYLTLGGVPPPSTSEESGPGSNSDARESARVVLSELYSRGKTSSDIAKRGRLPNGITDRKKLKEGTGEHPFAMEKITCKALKIKLGPEMRAIYPFVLNFGIAGDLEINGQVDPMEVRPSGSIRLDSGEVNLVATQVKLKRDHPNRAVFIPSQGLDPNLDISFVGADLMAMIQGRASTWQDHVVLTYLGTGAGEETLSPSEAAKIFEGQLAESLLEENGQLAFSSLAASTIENLLPRLETQGQFGKARWRLVSAPSIPGLLSLDPSTDPFRSLANLTLGSEFEVQFGKSLEASVARKLKDSEMATQWTLVYQLHRKLRMRLNSVASDSTQLLFEYSASPSYRDRNQPTFTKGPLNM